DTFESVAREWHARWKATRTDNHTAYVIKRLEGDVFSLIGKLPIGEGSAPRLVAVAQRIEGRGALDLAKGSLQTCNQILRYAVAVGYIERNPGAEIRPSDVLMSRKKTNYPRLSGKELPELLRKMAVYVGSPHTRGALQLIALTFVRTSELI